MNDSRGFVLAIDAGGTQMKSLLMDSSGVPSGPLQTQEARAAESLASVLSGYQSVICRAQTQARELGGGLETVAIATPGPFDYASGTSRMEHKFPSLRGISLPEALRESDPDLAAISFRFFHDVHSLLAGEQAFGAATGFERVVAVTLGTGIGFGCWLDGHIRDNGSGGPLISIYRSPYRGGILEDLVSGRGIVASYVRLHPEAREETLDARDIGRRALSGKDPVATAVFRDVGLAIGGALVDFLRMHAIECLVCGGQISKSFAAFEGGLRESLAEVSSLRRICAADDLDTASLRGVALLARTVPIPS